MPSTFWAIKFSIADIWVEDWFCESWIMSLIPSGGVIQGVVRDPSGAPLIGVLVVAESGRFRSHDTTDEFGAFHIQGVAPGNHTVRAWTSEPSSTHQEMMPLYAPQSQDVAGAQVFLVEEGGTVFGVEIILSSGAVITGGVSDAVLSRVSCSVLLVR